MAELVGNIPDDAVLQAQLDILYGQTPDITIKAHELPEESEPTVEKSGTLAEPVFNIGIPQAMGAVAAREYAKQAETARDAAILAGETAKEELNGIVASADDALDQKIAETGTLLDEKVATAAQRASEAASSAVAAAQKATAAEQAMQGAQAAQAQAEQSAQEAADSAAMSKDWAAGQPVTYSGTPVSIAYAGAQRIASITAYGENAHGGTTEAPVALTGVDSVFVGGRNLLPKATKTQTIYGVTFTPNPNGSVSVSGTCAGGIATYNYADNLIPISPNQVVYLSGASQLVKVVINEKTPSGAFVRNVLVDRGQGISGTLTKQKEENILYATLQVQIGDAPNLTIHPMLNLGESPLPYEPYQGSVTQLPIPRPLHEVGDVRDVCRTRVKSVYDKRVVLDGSSDEVFIQTNIIDGWIQIATESDAVIPESTSIVGSIKSSYLKAYAIEEVYSKKYSGISVDSNRRIRLSFKTSEYPDVTSVETAKTYLSAHPLTVYYQSTSYDGTNGLDVCLTEYQTGYIKSYADESITTAWISSTGALSTGAEIAYVLSSHETYATEPLDFDNAAGPLTVMTGGELEVRMTELIGSRSDVSNNTVAFTETAQDADISSGEKLSVLFGKIKKRFSVVNKLVNGAVYPNLGTNTNFPNPVNQRGATSYTGDGTSPYCIDRWRISNGTTYTVGTFTLSAANYANRACGMWQTNLLGEHWLSIGDNVTVSIYANGQLHTAVMQVLDRGSYSSFADVPAGYTCDDFEIVLCTYAGDNTVYNLGIYPKKPLTVNYIKWEKGSVATPYVPKDYGAELSECKRYFNAFAIEVMPAYFIDGNIHYLPAVLFPARMRVVPTIEIMSAGVGNVGVVAASAVTIPMDANGIREIIVNAGTSVYDMYNKLTLDMRLSADY